MMPSATKNEQHMETEVVSAQSLPKAHSIWDLGPLEKKESTQKAKDELKQGW